ncbi:hypothetical protein EHO61_12115 [Leptospira fluminis]|uniref:Lipoprotein n=1 Tax=Leptospira fluminis TaxID=2484979 RepID=A0A4R9GLT4_9LEPT|nr:hypothetical protein [Leptospira fluminis]TGK17164.1 hypothetical protein EHO61_12115 [Leptospira fluminis]
MKPSEKRKREHSEMPTLVRFALFLLLIGGLSSCQSVEFVPDVAYREDLIRTHKQSWKEIEILKQAPRNKSYEVFGRILLRNFGDGKVEKYYIDKIKKELFERGMDGMFYSGKGLVPVPATVFMSGTSAGYSTNVVELPQSAKVLEGIAFRYKESDRDGKTSR